MQPTQGGTVCFSSLRAICGSRYSKDAVEMRIQLKEYVNHDTERTCFQCSSNNFNVNLKPILKN